MRTLYEGTTSRGEASVGAAPYSYVVHCSPLKFFGIVKRRKKEKRGIRRREKEKREGRRRKMSAPKLKFWLRP